MSGHDFKTTRVFLTWLSMTNNQLVGPPPMPPILLQLFGGEQECHGLLLEQDKVSCTSLKFGMELTKCYIEAISYPITIKSIDYFKQPFFLPASTVMQLHPQASQMAWIMKSSLQRLNCSALNPTDEPRGFVKNLAY